MIELVLPSVKYKESFIAAAEDMKRHGREGFVSPAVQKFMDYDLARLENDFENYIVKPLLDNMNGINLPEGYVAGTDFWIIKDGVFVGKINLRHELTENLLRHGGHIGYVVIPSYRRQGIVTKALELCLKKAKEKGIEKVLLTCDATNYVSKHVIEHAMNKSGGYQDVAEKIGETTMLRYWINTLD